MEEPIPLLPECGSCMQRKIHLLKCGRCLSVYYCDVNCQKLHWKKLHKGECKQADARNVTRKDDMSNIFRTIQEYRQAFVPPPFAEVRSRVLREGQLHSFLDEQHHSTVEKPMVIIEERIEKNRIMVNPATASSLVIATKMLELGGHDNDNRCFSYVAYANIGGTYTHLFLFLSLRDNNLDRLKKVLGRNDVCLEPKVFEIPVEDKDTEEKNKSVLYEIKRL